MDIQTQDGILLRGIPDGTPDEVIKQRIATIRAGGQAPALTQQPAGDPTAMQKIQASAPMRAIQGMRDPIDAAAQFVSHLIPEGVGKVLDAPGKYLRNSDSPLLATIGDRFLADPSAKATDERLKADEKQYQQARQATGQSGFDASRFVGNVASPVNAAIATRAPSIVGASLPKLAGTGTVVGAAGGVLTPVTEDGDFGARKAAQVGLGAVTGAVMTPALAKVTEAVAPRIAAFYQRNFAPDQLGAEASLRTDEAIKLAFKEIGADMDSVPKAYLQQLRQQVVESLKQGKLPDVAAQVRKADFDALGVQPLRGQITRDATQYARERNLRAMPNMGEPILHRMEAQNSRLQELVGGYGGPQAAESQTAGQLLAQALKAKDESMRGGVTAAYKAARESTGKTAELETGNLASAYTQIFDDFADKIPTAVRNRFDKLVLDPATGKADVARRLTVEDGDKLLKIINDHVGADRATNTALDQLRSAVKRTLSDGPVDDVFAKGRSLASERFKAQDALPALAQASEGTLSADKFVTQHIINAETKNVKELAKALTGTPEGRLAFKEAKNQLGAYIQRAAFGENTAGDKILSPERLAKALRQIGTEKLKVFYSPQEVEQLHRISRVGAYIDQIPAASPVMGNPNMTWAGPMLGRIPGAPAALQMAAALGRTAKSGADVSASLSAKVPTKAAPMNPETVRQLSKALALGGAVSGGAAAR